MVVRSGRLLPSVIVGALVTGALALGAGVAGADEEISRSECEARNGQISLSGLVCTVGGVPYSILGGLGGAATPPSESATAEAPAPAQPTTVLGGVGAVVGGVTDSLGGTNGSVGSGSATPGTNASAGSGSEATSGTGASSGSSGPSAQAGGSAAPVVRPPSGVQAPDVRGGLLTPAVSASGGLAARVPALGFGTVDPRLLMVPTGSPLRTLTGVTPGSPVTTSSDVQAMALDGLPSGLGTPAVLGVLILSTLAGFALRHRVLRRVRLAAAPKPEPAT